MLNQTFAEASLFDAATVTLAAFVVLYLAFRFVLDGIKRRHGYDPHNGAETHDAAPSWPHSNEESPPQLPHHPESPSASPEPSERPQGLAFLERQKENPNLRAFMARADNYDDVRILSSAIEYHDPLGRVRHTVGRPWIHGDDFSTIGKVPILVMIESALPLYDLLYITSNVLDHAGVPNMITDTLAPPRWYTGVPRHGRHAEVLRQDASGWPGDA